MFPPAEGDVVPDWVLNFLTTREAGFLRYHGASK